MKTVRMGRKMKAAQEDSQRLWRLGCLHDKIGTASLFVVWSPANPYSGPYNAAVKKFLRLKRAQEARVARRDVIDSLGMHEVRGNLGGRYIE